MPRDLFDTVTHPPAHVGARSGVTVSLVAHAAALAVIVVVPLVATDVLPVPGRAMDLVMVDAVLPPEPPPPIAPAARAEPGPASAVASPIEPPSHVAPEPANRPPADLGTVTRDAPFAGLAGGTGDDGRIVGLTPPPPPPPVTAREPVRVGGSVTAPSRIADVPPVYPAIARAAGIEGTVILQATIGLDGHVQDVQVLRSVPLLDESAVTAVRQWRYSPTRLNGEPVAVIMTVTVSFRLR